MPPAAGTVRRRTIRAVVTTMICVAVAAGLAVGFRESIALQYHLGQVCDHDPADRERSMRYLAARADRPVVAERIGRALDAAGETCFDQAVHFLAGRGRWDSRFGLAWVRYLTRRSSQAPAPQRAAIAVELGRMLWLGKPHHDDPRIKSAIEAMLRDEDEQVRMNALSAAACLPEPHRRKLLELARQDVHEEIRARATVLLALVERGNFELPDRDAREEADPILHRLAELESMRVASAPIEITRDMPDLIRLQAVRVSTLSAPEDLLSIFDSEQPTLRDLACIVAIERFTPRQCRELAIALIGSFREPQRMGGAMLAGLVAGAQEDTELLRRLRVRSQSPGSWVVQQHCWLALTMLGEKPAGFEPLTLLQHQKVPRTTLNLALLHMGRLEVLDWLFKPFGQPPVGGVEGLRLLLDFYRYAHVLHRYLPQMPQFPFWADAASQRQRVELIRDWYLVARPALRFSNGRWVWQPGTAGEASRG